jgi:hypothetical protein
MKALDSVQSDTYRMPYAICWWMPYIVIIDKVDLRSNYSLDTDTIYIYAQKDFFFVHSMIRRPVHLSALHEFIHNA